jgi:hypothetical protein
MQQAPHPGQQSTFIDFPGWRMVGAAWVGSFSGGVMPIQKNKVGAACAK